MQRASQRGVHSPRRSLNHRLAHWCVGSAALAIGLLAAPGVARADPAGPTDYRSEVVSITPTTDVISVSIEGGDSFVRIVVAEGHELTVLGYDDEPYLRISADGTVEENRRSAATYYNTERFGTDTLPEVVDNDAPPDWVAVGRGGSWAWHDHRAHWMGPEPPIGLDAGESLPPQVVPVVVDGVRVDIAVQITLQSSPSVWPAVFGVLTGLLVVLLAGRAGPATLTFGTLVLATTATVVGVAQFRSLPAETGPLMTWWLLPAIAVACAVATIVTYGRWPTMQSAVALLAGLQLALWAYTRRATLTKPVLPTDLPFWFDRIITAAALAGGTALTVVAGVALFRPPPQPLRGDADTVDDDEPIR